MGAEFGGDGPSLARCDQLETLPIASARYSPSERITALVGTPVSSRAVGDDPSAARHPAAGSTTHRISTGRGKACVRIRRMAFEPCLWLAPLTSRPKFRAPEVSRA